jgi:hypothetical protein
LFTLAGLHPDNLHTLRLLAARGPRLADVTKADLASAAWSQDVAELLRRSRGRIAMYTQLAKGLGKSHRGPNVVLVEFDPEVLGALPLDEVEVTLLMERMVEALASAMAKKGFEFGGLAASAESALGSQRHILIQMVGPSLETAIHYRDDEPDPGEEREHKTTIIFHGWIDGPESAADWAKKVLDALPSAASRHSGPPWPGIDLTCPSCGHPDVITSQTIPKFQRCLECGNDSITGAPQQLLSKKGKAEEKLGGIGGGIFASTLPIIGFWIYFTVTGSFPFLIFAITHLLGAAGIGFGGFAFRRALREYATVKTEQMKGGAAFKHPEAVAENQKRIQAMGSLDE